MLPVSRGSCTCIAGSIVLDTCENIRKLIINIMFIYDPLNFNIFCPKLLFQLWLLFPVFFTRSLSLFHVSNYSTNFSIL